MKIGTKVQKSKGYFFKGEVRSIFTNSKGETRVVVEETTFSRTEKNGGMLHIFNQKQLEKC